MFPNAPTLFLLTAAMVVAVISSVGFTVIWTVFAATLAVTTVVAIHRSIPRKER
jgi:hypothetical protein